MFIAKDKDGVLVDIDDATFDEEDYCPSCGAPLIIKAGLQNATHFAHKSRGCTDDWQYDMSEWHRRMQSYFPENTREVVVELDGEIHRADILIENTVIEFQHSAISAEEFSRRNEFFKLCGYRIAWVFDVSEQYSLENLYYSDEENEFLLTWKNPIRIFSFGSKPSDYNAEYSVWLFTGEDYKGDYIRKVIWTPNNDYGEPSFRKIIISQFPIQLNGSFAIEDFFISQRKTISNMIKELKEAHEFVVRFSGTRGKPKTCYICPKTDKFGLDLRGNKGCLYCRYCYMLVQNRRKDLPRETAVYCCHPKEVRKAFEQKSSRECTEAPTYYL